VSAWEARVASSVAIGIKTQCTLRAVTNVTKYIDAVEKVLDEAVSTQVEDYPTEIETMYGGRSSIESRLTDGFGRCFLQVVDRQDAFGIWSGRSRVRRRKF
jgi:hypothetical protein